MAAVRRFIQGCIVVAVAFHVASCRRTPGPTPIPTPAPSARACPAPAITGVQWIAVNDSSGLTLALPPGYTERDSGGQSRLWELRGDFQQWMSFGLIRGDLGLPAYRRAYQPELMPDYSECTDTVAGHPTFIQAWRTPNGVFRNYRRLDRYDVFAIWEVAPGVYAYQQGGTYWPPTQVLFLAAIRAWRPPLH